ncbi:MAG: hypothetical protein ACLP5V_00940 [Candidatus Bathyarchaeia archaeon]
MTVWSNGRLRPALYLLLVIILPLLMAGIQATTADQSLVRTESVQLNVGDSLVIRSDHLAIQQVFVEGNLSAAQLTKPNQYPANNFEIQALTSGTYEVKAIFSQATDYNVYLLVEDGGTTTVQNSTSYYISGGTFELDVSAYFNPRPVDISATVPSISPWASFVDWVGSFGQAFPSWVKALYLILGVQFLAVGGLWIRREAASREGTRQRLDSGEKAYLWLDIVYKFLLASFVAIVAIMGGELILLFVLRFMFLVSLDLLSLWDLFVVGFAAGAIIIVYLIRFTLEKAFDLKPVEGE